MREIKEGMAVYILLDRTGSMARLWDEAVMSVNAYVRELVVDEADDRVTLAVFDAYKSGMQYDVLRDAVPIREWKPVGNDEVLPRGATPLLDAVMRTITVAEEAGKSKTAIVVMTDGYENASREVTLEAARAAIERVQAKNWQVNFLGANFDGFAQAGTVGVQHGDAMNYSAGHACAAMSSTARNHSRYRNRNRPAGYTQEDRNDAGEPEVE
jgi:Mg-chelatase subunit ChlD